MQRLYRSVPTFYHFYFLFNFYHRFDQVVSTTTQHTHTYLGLGSDFLCVIFIEINLLIAFSTLTVNYPQCLLLLSTSTDFRSKWKHTQKKGRRKYFARTQALASMQYFIHLSCVVMKRYVCISILSNCTYTINFNGSNCALTE